MNALNCCIYRKRILLLIPYLHINIKTTFFQPESEFYPVTPQNSDKTRNTVYLKSVRKETVSQDAIKDRAIKMKKIDWQKAEWFQPESLKLCMEVDFNKLVASLQKNDYADQLKVWEYAPGKIKILDGHHRQKALEYCLKNGDKKPPKMLNAVFMDCKNEKEAAKLCLIYASEYAKIQEQGFYEFLHTFNLPFDDIKMDVEFPGIDLDNFEENYYKEPDLSDFDKVSEDLKGFQVKDYGFGDFEKEGYFQMPKLRDDMLGKIPQGLSVWVGETYENYKDHPYWLWNYGSSSLKGLDKFDNVILGFYVDDYRFDNFFSEYPRYIAKMLNLGIKTAIMPNFSLWIDESIAVQIYNSFRSKWVARIMQEVGINIIPDINFSGGDSYKFCFDGLPVGCQDVCAQAQNIPTDDKKAINLHIKGIMAAYEKLKFKRLWIYSGGEKKKKLYDIFRNDFEVKIINSFTYKRRELKGG